MYFSLRNALVVMSAGLATCIQVEAQGPTDTQPPPDHDSILATLELPSDFQQTAALYELLSRADIDDVKRFLAEADSIANANDRQAGTNIIYGRYLDLNAEAAVDDAINTGPTIRGSLLYTLFYSWSKFDLEAAIRKSHELPDPQLRQIARQSIMKARAAMGDQDLSRLSSRLGDGGEQALRRVSLENVMRLAASDPHAAIAQALESGSAEQQGQVLAVIGSVWAGSDPDAALDYSREPTMRRHATFRDAVVSTIAQKNHDKALALLDSNSLSPREEKTTLTFVFANLGRSAPEHALEHALALDNDEHQQTALGSMFGPLGQQDPVRAIRLMESMGGQRLWEPYISNVLNSYAAIDPEAAFAWASKLEFNANQYMSSVIKEVAGESPDQALKLIGRMPVSQERLQALSHIIEQSARERPALAAEFLDLMPRSSMYQQTARKIADTWLKQDAGAAMSWIMSLPRQTQANLLGMLAWSVPRQDPELAMSLFPEIASGKVRQQWANGIVQQLAQDDPDRAINWLSDFEDEPFHDALLATVAQAVAQDDVPAAMDLADGIQGPQTRDAAKADIVRTWAARDMHEAGKFVRSLNDENLKSNLASALAMQWSEYDPESARAWIMRFDDPAIRDVALAATLSSSYISNAEADETIGHITSAEVRHSAISQYLQNLSRYDTRSAREFLARNPLPEEQQASLLELFDSIEQGF